MTQQNNNIQVALLPHQKQFLFSNAPSTGLVGGFGCGKSHVATIKSVKKLVELRTNIGYYLPTYGLIKDIAFGNFTDILNLFQIKYTLNETDKVFKTSYGNIYMRSMDNPTNIVGYETGYAVIDEADILSVEKMRKAHKAIVARNRKILEGDLDNSVDMVSTPEGFKFLYEYYIKDGSDRRVLVKGKTLDNPYLPQSYIDNLYDTYPSNELEAYMSGEFVNLNTGTVYRSFNRKLNTDNTKYPATTDVLYIGMDFNITNMACTISIKQNGIRYVVDEITDAYDTADICKIIRQRYPSNKVIVYPDASGNSRNTSGKSDHDIIRKSGFRVIAPKKNPNVRDRINNVNKTFEDNKTFINSDKCPVLVDSLEKQSYKSNGDPDKQSGYDHINDAFGYEVCNSEGTTIKKRVSNVF